MRRGVTKVGGAVSLRLKERSGKCGVEQLLLLVSSCKELPRETDILKDHLSNPAGWGLGKKNKS